MRTKFKAWKKTNGPEMFEDIRAIDFEKNIIRIGYKLSEYTTRIDEESLDNVELLQSTGLFDKNGKEIFKGDILKVEYGDLLGETRETLIIAKNPFEYSMEEAKFLDFSYIVEIIGNKFEHPHLLGED